MNSTEAMDDIAAKIRQLRVESKGPDWSVDVQNTSKTLWVSLASEQILTSETWELFASFLSDDDVYTLAQLILPELRPEMGHSDPQKLSPSQQQLLLLTTVVRNRLASLRTSTQTSFDPGEFTYEKAIYADAALYRSRLMLHHSGNYSEKEEGDIAQWLASCPVLRSRDSDGAAALQ